ncbi:ATP-dependent RNA helicase DDX24 [Galendromus occidentalis]|uniref:ATP-dependent RNA helicase n=1 Tax=Galendromus occidentalis TaxID=34638 RepID=A0AAJ6VYN3_9ACAR|nr:ATP-dependent RNA helicase DDX24 [Galendromus occidentalis]
MRSKKTQKKSLKRIGSEKLKEPVSSSKENVKKATKVMLLKNKKKSGKSRDQKLVETYGGELVDLTDLTAWGDFDAEYDEPRDERYKMMKKVKGDQAQDTGFEDEEDSDEELGTEDDSFQLRLASDSEDGDGVEGDETSDDENDEPTDLSESVAELVDESMDCGDAEADDDGDEPLEKMPFKGPLAVKVRPPKKRRPKPSSLLDGVDTDSDGDRTKDDEAMEVAEAGEDQSGAEEDVSVELDDAEKALTKEWEIFEIEPRILKALAQLRYTEPSEIQSQCLIPAIRDRLDILGAAETGSGKTLAFGIPLVHRLLQERCRNKLGALILTPTRELAVQIKKHLMDITKFTNLHVVCIVGGLSHEKQTRLLAKRPEIIVATPGRLFELVQEDPQLQEQLISVRCLVIDEADRMIQKGHFEEMQLILKFMNSNRIGKRQNLVFSATLTMDPHLPERVIERKKKKRTGRLDQLKAMLGMTKPKIIDTTKKIGTAETLTESRIYCEKPEQKDALLYYFLKMHPGRTLVFCNSIDCVRRLKSVLEALRMKPMGLHAEMQQRQRLKHLDRFAATPNSVLIATDVAARGLDIKNIEHVIHFNVSKASETYIHRSGRTARSKQSGLSVMLVDGRELPQYRKLLHALKRTDNLPPFPVQENILKICKARVAKARELETLQYRQKKVQKSDGWFAKCAKDADIELDENLLKSSDWNENRKAKVKVESVKRELDALLSRRLVPLNQKVGNALDIPDKDPLKLVRGAKGTLD